MKQLIFLIFFICFTSFVNAQSSQSLGLNTSYSYSNVNNFYFPVTSQSPNFGLTYNYFLNKKHGIVTELGVDIARGRFLNRWIDLVYYDVKAYNFNYSLYYIFKSNQFFVKTGLNAQAFNVIQISGGGNIPKHLQEENSNELIFIPKKNISLRKEYMQLVPEFHFALGRDFDLGKINIRINGFVERAFIIDDYIDYGVSAGVFYQFGK